MRMNMAKAISDIYYFSTLKTEYREKTSRKGKRENFIEKR